MVIISLVNVSFFALNIYSALKRYWLSLSRNSHEFHQNSYIRKIIVNTCDAMPTFHQLFQTQHIRLTVFESPINDDSFQVCVCVLVPKRGDYVCALLFLYGSVTGCVCVHFTIHNRRKMSMFVCKNDASIIADARFHFICICNVIEALLTFSYACNVINFSAKVANKRIRKECRHWFLCLV